MNINFLSLLSVDLFRVFTYNWTFYYYSTIVSPVRPSLRHVYFILNNVIPELKYFIVNQYNTIQYWHDWTCYQMYILFEKRMSLNWEIAQLGNRSSGNRSTGNPLLLLGNNSLDKNWINLWRVLIDGPHPMFGLRFSKVWMKFYSWEIVLVVKAIKSRVIFEKYARN